MRKDGSYIKTERLQTICKKIQENIAEGVNMERLLDWIEFNIGFRRDTAQDYVNKIIRLQGWIVVDGTIKAEI